MSATAADFLAQMRGLLDAGVKERPAGSNHAPPVTDAFFDDKWCAMTVSHCLKRIGFPWFHTAQVVQIRNWAKQGHHGMSWMDLAHAHPGDMLIWEGPKGRHVNVVEARRGDGSIVHLGGNESDAVRRATWKNPTATGMAIVGVARMPFAAPRAAVIPGLESLPSHVLGSRILRPEPPLLSGTDVAEWQQLMRVPVDGSYGAPTVAATQDFQRKVSLTPVDGKVGKDTLGAMRRIIAFVMAAEAQK